jgi:hypothetical protein
VEALGGVRDGPGVVEPEGVGLASGRGETTGGCVITIGVSKSSLPWPPPLPPSSQGAQTSAAATTTTAATMAAMASSAGGMPLGPSGVPAGDWLKRYLRRHRTFAHIKSRLRPRLAP